MSAMRFSIHTAFFLTLLIGVLVLTFFLFLPYLLTIAIAGTAAVLFHPLHVKLTKKLWGSKFAAAFLVVLFTYAVILVPLAFISIHITNQATDLYNQLTQGEAFAFQDIVTFVEAQIQRIVPNVQINLEQYAGQALNWVTSNLSTFFAGTIRTVMLIFIGTIAYYYMLKDGDKFIAELAELTPLTKAENTKIVSRLRLAVDSVIRGSLTIAVLQGIVSGIGYAIFGVPNAILLGAFTAVGALIPSVGTSIVVAPVVLYLYFTSNTLPAVGLAIWGTIAVGTIDNFLHPILVGKSMQLHPFFIFFAVLGGISFFGMAGFIIGPLVISLLFALLDIFKKQTLKH